MINQWDRLARTVASDGVQQCILLDGPEHGPDGMCVETRMHNHADMTFCSDITFYSDITFCSDKATG